MAVSRYALYAATRTRANVCRVTDGKLQWVSLAVKHITCVKFSGSSYLLIASAEAHLTISTYSAQSTTFKMTKNRPGTPSQQAKTSDGRLSSLQGHPANKGHNALQKDNRQITRAPEKVNEALQWSQGIGLMNQPDDHGILSYQMQLMLLEQQNNKRLRDGMICATCGGQDFKMKS